MRREQLGRGWVLALVLAPAGAAAAGGPDWARTLAKVFSERLSGIEAELAAVGGELPGLPGVPVADQGGTGGFAALHPAAEPGAAGDRAVEVRWPRPAAIDMVALVPARRYTARGLEAQFGTPDAFTVDLIADDGQVVARVADERGVWAHPVRAGHPFVFQVAPAAEAAGLRITAGRLRLDPEISDSHVHAWAEVFAFEGPRNLALGARVESLSGMPAPSPWQWSKEFLVDGQTPLGLPEVPAGKHPNIGWLSEGRATATEPAWLEVDLGAPKDIDGIRLLPAKRPTSDLPSGFGFPKRLRISVGETRAAPAAGAPPTAVEREFRNPGHSPVFIPLDRCRGRYVRIEATELWKQFDKYPAFFALSEVEALDGEQNIALGALVRSPDGMGNVIGTDARYWGTISLCDGFGPDGRLVPPRDWLLGLDRRLALETRAHRLRLEAQGIMADWRRAALTAVVLLALAGAVAIVALPIRYRVREARQLVRVRERIAGDLHDEVGSNLGSIQMFADLAERRSGPSAELKRIQRIAAETVSAVRDIVWLLRPHGVHRIGTVEHLRETSSIMLEPLAWEFTSNEAAWGCELPDEATRHLFLFFREALHNVLRHAGARHVTVRVEQDAGQLRLAIADDGCGIPAERLERPATLRALRQRAAALGAELKIDTQVGEGTRLELLVPTDAAHLSRAARSAPRPEPRNA